MIDLENAANIALIVLTPMAGLGFLIEYVWSNRLEKSKPDANLHGGARSTTPPGFMRSQEQINREAEVNNQYNEKVSRYTLAKERFDKLMPYIKRYRLYIGIAFLLATVFRLVVWWKLSL